MSPARAARLGALALALAGLLPACGEVTPRQVTPDEATSIPPGTATGASFSGTFFADRVTLEGCSCRRGPCFMVHTNTGTMTLTQSAGALTVVLVAPPLFSGGIDQDGRFSVGESTVVNTLRDTGVIHGTVRAQTSIEAIIETTIVGTVDTVTYDCDLQSSVHATYTGP